jgi:hypothetical protein
MSRANRTGVTRKGQNLEISFGRVHFSFFLKKAKIQKNPCDYGVLSLVFCWTAVSAAAQEGEE